MSGIGLGIAILAVLGICLGFVIVWILKSEKARKIAQEDIERLKSHLSAREREVANLEDNIEVLEGTIKTFRDAVELVLPQNGKKYIAANVVIDMTSRFNDMDKENKKLNEELTEAQKSLEEVFKAVCD